MNLPSNDSFRNKVLPILGVWFLAALGTGLSGILSKLPRPGLQALLAILTFLVLFFFFRRAGFRQWILHLDVRWLLSFHLCRFVGFYFLWLYSRGELPYAFAVPGGYGDIFIALGALVLCSVRFEPPRFRQILGIWNGLGLADILFVVITAARLAIQDPASVRALTFLPLSLLPLYFVPLIIASHGMIATGLWREPAFPFSPRRNK